MDTKYLDKQIKAKKRVEDLKGFYGHLVAYLGVNLFISISKIIRNMGNGETFGEAFWDLGNFAVWLLWGIGLAFHAMKVFAYNPFFSKEWEERQIQKYMEEDKREANKYK